MSDSLLDTKASHVLSFPLTVKQQVWLQFILPGIITSVLYLLTIATDIAVGVSLLLERHMLPGLVTLILIYIPALVCFILQLAVFKTPEPYNFKTVISWLFKETVHFIVFPLRTIQSLGEMLFWLIEAAHGKNDLEESLRGSHSALPQCVHVYLFLQPFLQSAPQAILQSHLLLMNVSTDVSTERAQILCIICSVMTVALSIAFYHRYESQCEAGRIAVLPRSLYQHVTKDEEELSSGLEDDNPVGTLVLFLSWFFFLLARMFSLVISSYFHLIPTLSVIFIHYVVMIVCFLKLNSGNFFHKICLSGIAVFCLVEVAVKYNKLILLFFIFFVSCLIEDVGLTVYWFKFTPWSGWWCHYAIYTIILTHVIAIAFFLLYGLAFRPNTVQKSTTTSV